MWSKRFFTDAAEKVRVFGIELLDIRFKRINYNESVRPKIYDRMISERRQIAERFLPSLSLANYTLLAEYQHVTSPAAEVCIPNSALP